MGSPQANAANFPVEPSVQSPPFYQMFLKGQPKALGAVQIALGFVHFLIGTVLLYTTNAYTSVVAYCYIAYWGGGFYIISGSLVVSVADKKTLGLVKGALAINLISGLISLAEFSLVIIDIVHPYYYYYGPCYTNPCTIFENTIFIIRLITLIHLVFIAALQVSMSTTAFAFGIRSLKQKTPDIPEVIVVQNMYQIPAVMPEVSAQPKY
ncbi:membrane-spanning 4-domains subfamily A member 4A-like [Hyla sarda]|uniref:membrane-spanning 4-domains subfamily A member 4A-like n=1 Tax=Hyla sarda TaxID=327740 RepID=UPI0024C33398|nr:membrane-spanning 4-domains subfamily A member 4A-like [Hyla sarda]